MTLEKSGVDEPEKEPETDPTPEPDPTPPEPENKPGDATESEPAPTPSEPVPEPKEAEPPSEAPETAVNPLEAKYRAILIQGVPTELVGLLPGDLGKLEEYLASEPYNKLKAKLVTHSPTVEPTLEPSPKKPAPPTQKELWVGIGNLFG